MGAENLASTGNWSPDRPARSESLYWLRYSGPWSLWILKFSEWCDKGLLGCDVQCCVSTAWCFWGMCRLNLQQHEPLNTVMQHHIPEHWNRLWILSALYTLFFICYEILVQAVPLFNVHPKFWYSNPLVYCWPEILLQAVLFIVDPKFWYKQFLMLTQNSDASVPLVWCRPKILVQAVLLFAVHPKFWYGQSSCLMLTPNSVASILVHCWPKILVQAVLNADPKFWYKHSSCVM
jgi:hypothetical protein